MPARIVVLMLVAAAAAGCSSARHHAAAAPASPEHLRTPALECRGDFSAGTATYDHFGNVPGRPGPPAQVVREQFADTLTKRDRVTLANERPDVAVVTVTRDKRTVAVIELARASEAGWLVDEAQTCDEFKTY